MRIFFTSIPISPKGKIKNLVLNASNEFLNISIYFILGAFISSIFVVFFQDSLINNITSGKVIGVIIMMGLGFLLSLIFYAVLSLTYINHGAVFLSLFILF